MLFKHSWRGTYVVFSRVVVRVLRVLLASHRLRLGAVVVAMVVLLVVMLVLVVMVLVIRRRWDPWWVVLGRTQGRTLEGIC